MTTVLGRVAALYRYPVKSMAAEALEAADVSWHGLSGDRAVGIPATGVSGGRFPWLTLRQNNQLSQYRPRLESPDEPDRSKVLVCTPDGAEFEVTAPELAEELGAQVMKLDRGTFDSMPLSLVSTRTVADISALAGSEPADPLRFRPNLLIEPAGTEPFPEDDWVGRELGIGELVMRVDRRDKRCVIVNIDPRTGLRTPVVLKAVARHRDMCLGVYGSVVTPGRVAVGDPVVLR